MLFQGLQVHIKSPMFGKGFIVAYVFPDGEAAPLHVAIQAAESVGFEVRDVENLREHYVRTAESWITRLQANSAAAKAIVGEPYYRLFHLYLVMAEHELATGNTNASQTLFLKPDQGRSGLPMTREDWYR